MEKGNVKRCSPILLENYCFSIEKSVVELEKILCIFSLLKNCIFALLPLKRISLTSLSPLLFSLFHISMTEILDIVIAQNMQKNYFGQEKTHGCEVISVFKICILFK